MENENYRASSTQIYDSVFWTVVNTLKQYVPALVNEAFGKHYTEKAKVTLKPGKQVTDRPQEGLTRREVDALIEVSENDKDEDYHFECETNGRKTVALRIVQYASGYASQSASMIDDEAVIRIPNSAVIFLRSDSTNISFLTIRVEYPGGSGSYKVPVLKIKDYSIEEVFEKKLLLLIPFMVFKISDEEYAEMNKTGIQQLKELIDDVGTRLNMLVESGEIEPWERGNLLRYLNTVLTSLIAKYENVKKGADQIMGGYIIKTDIDEAMEKSRVEGREEGENLFGILISKLYTLGRMDDVRRCATDREYRQTLYREFQLA